MSRYFLSKEGEMWIFPGDVKIETEILGQKTGCLARTTNKRNQFAKLFC